MPEAIISPRCLCAFEASVSFPGICNRFVELEKDLALPMAVFIKKVWLGKCTGTGFVNNTTLWVCCNQRILMHKVFKGIAARGKCSMGLFFGFKLHPVCNEQGGLLSLHRERHR
jgi:hypothetical protein